MTKRVPKFVADKYHGGSHEFRSHKRALIRAILKRISSPRDGCAYFPNGSTYVEVMQQAAEHIKKDISVKNWGR